MAARINPKHLQAHRDKIQTSQLINRLQSFALGGVDGKTGETIEISPARLKAIEILLRKTLPDLQAVTVSGDGDDGAIVNRVELAFVSHKKD